MEGNAPHPVEGFLIKYPPVCMVSLTGQQMNVGVVADGVLGGLEQFGELFYSVLHKCFSLK